MNYIGNDIVSLAQSLAQQKHRSQAWLDKVFLEEEQQFIIEAKDPEQMLWILWACKESAYKSFVKLERKRLFRPKAIQLQVGKEGEFNYIASYKEWKVGICIDLQASYVHCISVTLPCATIDWQMKVFQLPNQSQQDGSKYMRTQLALELERQGWKKELVFKKGELGIPFIAGVEQLDLSFSHDGEYFAYAFKSNGTTL